MSTARLATTSSPQKARRGIPQGRSSVNGRQAKPRVQLFTIGYEGKTIHSFLDRLAGAEVQVVVDVRELPLSRKPGFSKSRLHETLTAQGIEYVSLAELGSPRHLREELRAEGDYDAFFAAYREHLREREGLLATLLSLLPEQTVCLMCYEADPGKCHRSEIAAELQRHNGKELEVRHL